MSLYEIFLLKKLMHHLEALITINDRLGAVFVLWTTVGIGLLLRGLISIVMVFMVFWLALNTLELTMRSILMV